MFKLLLIDIIHTIAAFCMAFFLGLSYETSERVRAAARIICFISMCIVMACVTYKKI